MESHDNRISEGFSSVVRYICREYGLYGNIVSGSKGISGSDNSHTYIVAGFSPDFENDKAVSLIKPEDILRRNKRNHKLFYPESWAFDLTSGNGG